MSTSASRKIANRRHLNELRAKEYVKVLLKSRGKTRDKLLKSAPNCVIKHICNLCNVGCTYKKPLYSERAISLMSGKKAHIKGLLSKRLALKKKRQIIQQGGFWPILATILAPVVGGLLGKLTSQQ